VPGLFPPVEIDGEHFYDGGLVNSVPLDRAIQLGAEVIYVLQVGRIEAPLRPPERLHESALIAFEIARRHMFARALKAMPDDIELHLLPSGNPVAFDDRRQIKWKDTSNMVELVDGAYDATQKYLTERTGG
jgi:NTE family protein